MSPHLRTLFLALTATAAAHAATSYRATFICGSSSQACYPRGINNAGEVVGNGVEGSLTLEGPSPIDFLYSGGVLKVTRSLPCGDYWAINDQGQIVGTAGVCTSTPATCTLGINSAAEAINDSGQYVGWSQNGAFLCSAGVATFLGFLPGGTNSVAKAINNSGQIVGSSKNAAGHDEAFLYSGGVMTGLGTLPGYTDSVATAINDRSQIVGYATDSSGSRQAFLYSNGTMAGLGALPGDSYSSADAINNKGDIVGASARACSNGLCNVSAAFLWSGEQMRNLNSLTGNALPAPLVEATGINDAGEIIAGDGAWAYVLTPTAGRFVAVTPCRVADTRRADGALGGPSLEPRTERSFNVLQGACGIPPTAVAYSLNVTAVPRGGLGYLTVWPTGSTQPLVSTLNSPNGNAVANAAIVRAGQAGAVSVYADAITPTDVVLDINGYFDSAAGDPFYPVQPCRVADTRLMGELNGLMLAGNSTVLISMPLAPCNLPATASAYSANVTVVPRGYLGF